MTPERPPRRRDPENSDPQPCSAQGHRFGPDLECRDCGIRYGDHQRAPKPCKPTTKTVAGAAPRSTS